MGKEFDSTMSFSGHVQTPCKSAFKIINSDKISKIIPKTVIDSCATTLVSCHPDYCNSLLIGKPLQKATCQGSLGFSVDILGFDVAEIVKNKL